MGGMGLISEARALSEPADQAGRSGRNLRNTSGSTPGSASPEPGATEARQIGVLVVAGHSLFTDFLRNLLAAEAGIAEIGHARTFAEGLAKLGRLNPDIVLVDFRLPGGSVIDFANTAHGLSPNAKLILLTEDDGLDTRFAAVEAGAFGWVQTSRAPLDLADAIRQAAAGRVLISPQSIASILNTRHRVRAVSEQITPREMETLRLLAEGLPTREIASRFGVSYATVRTHIYRLSRRLGAHSKLEVVARAREFGLI